MFAMFESCSRSLGAAGAALLLAGIVVLPSTAVAQAAAPADANQQVVVRDAATGELRMPTAAETQALKDKSVVVRKAASSTLPKVHTSGARGARLTDEFLSYSVLVRQADGTLTERCFDTLEAAEAALKAAPVSKINVAPTE